MSSVNRVQALWAEFEQRQKEGINFGASDTEPDAVWQWFIADTVRALAWGNDPPQVPKGVRTWQLFHGGSATARRLEGTASKMQRALRIARRGNEWGNVVRWLTDRCWRAGINVH